MRESPPSSTPVTPTVRFNDLQGNAQAGLRIAPNQTIQIDGSCNYWGSEAGPSGAGPGDGSAVVVDPDSQGIGIMTERDVLYAIGAGLDCDTERTAAHLTWDVVYAGPDWTLTDAAAAMARGGFRHLVVIEEGEVLGVISVRDIMRVWAQQRVPIGRTASEQGTEAQV